MGREASCNLTYLGQSGAGKLLLEAGDIILRGELRGRIARDQIVGFHVVDDDLVILTPDGPLRATLGTKEAQLWVKALAKPLPTLAEKLGIHADSALWVIGPLTDAALMAAVTDHPSADRPALILAEVPNQAAFGAALTLCHAQPQAAFWGVTRKGKSAFTDADLRAQMRAAGYIDSKSCAVSDAFTATRYSRRSA